MDGATDLVGVRAAAAALGVNPSTISRQLRSGVIPNRGTADRPLVDLAEARSARAGNLDRGKAKGIRSGDPELEPDELPLARDREDRPRPRQVTLNTAKTAREAAQARMAQLDLEERLGNLLDRDDVARATTEILLTLRQGLTQGIPDLAERLVGLDDVNQVATLIEDAIRTALERTSHEFAKLAAG